MVASPIVEEIHTEAIVLRRRPFGESDLIAVLLTATYGKISGIARGARRSRKRFAGSVLDPFQEVSVHMTRRPAAALLFLHECRLLRSHDGVASSPEAYAWACYLVELCERMVPEHDPCPHLYRLLSSTLEALPSADPIETTAHHFILGLLDRAGWSPDFAHCGLCGSPASAAVRPILDERGSGVICARHEAERAGIDPRDPSFRPSRRVIDEPLLSYLRAVTGSPSLPVDDVRVLTRASALLDRLLDLHLQRPLRSRSFLAHVRSSGPAGGTSNDGRT